MADSLALDLNKFEDQMDKFIEIYYNLLKKGGDEPLVSLKNDAIKWKEQIIKLLDDIYTEDSPKSLKIRKKQIKEDLNEAIKKKHLNIEFYLILEIAEFLYETYFDKIIKKNQKKSNEYIQKNMARCIYKELIELRNKLSHDENPSYEYILRFYEDQYFLIKFMKPVNAKFELSDYIIKEIKINIHLYLLHNLYNGNSFELNPLKEELINFELLNKKLDNKVYNNHIINKQTEKAIQSLFTFTPLKLTKYEFNTIELNENNINNNKNKEKNDDDDNDEKSEDNEEKEDKEIYEQSISRNSLTNFSNLSSSSERSSSINENTEFGNIKKEDDDISLVNNTKTDIHANL